MAIRLSSLTSAKQILKQQSRVPRGHVAVYVGEIEMKRFYVPIAYLNHPAFLQLLKRAEEEFGFSHPMGGLTIPCNENAFLDLLTSHGCTPLER